MRALWLEDQQLKFIENAPMPIPGQGEAVIKMTMAGICSTDLELVRGYYPFIGIPGHEFVGEVVSSPDEPAWVGRRVVGEINITCGQCHTCRAGYPRHCENRKTLGIHDWQGTFAEYFKLPLANLHQIPDNLTDEIAVFTEPFAAALEILAQTEITQADHVLVIGAGRLGILTAAILRETGCSCEVVIRYEKQQVILANLGIATVFEAELGSKKYDMVIEATGSPAGFDLASQFVRPRGRIIMKSTYKGNIDVNISRIVVDEITLIGSRCGAFEPALEDLTQGKFDPRLLIDGVFPIHDGIDAFELAARPGILKVLLVP